MHKTAYDMRISDWSSDVCSSDLPTAPATSSTSPLPPRTSASSPSSSRCRKHHQPERSQARQRLVAVPPALSLQPTSSTESAVAGYLLSIRASHKDRTSVV